MKNPASEFQQNFTNGYNEPKHNSGTNVHWNLDVGTPIPNFYIHHFFANLLLLRQRTKYAISQTCIRAIQPNSPSLSIRYSCKTTAILRRNHRAVSMNSGQTDRHVLGVAKSKIQIWPTYYSLLKFKMSEKTITWPLHLHQTNWSTLLNS